MTDAEFIHAFEALALPKESFRHADHIRAAWCYFRTSDDFATGSARFVHHFRRYVRSIGADAKYHETITWFYLARVFERLARSSATQEWREFSEGNPDLLDREMAMLKACYRPETLHSPLARRIFLLPDAATTEPATADIRN